MWEVKQLDILVLVCSLGYQVFISIFFSHCSLKKTIQNPLMISLITWNVKRNDTNELTKQIETHRLTKCTYGWWGKGIIREFRMVMHTLLYLNWITNKDLLYSTWNSTQCYVAAWIGGRVWGKWIYVSIFLCSLFT